MTRSAWRLPGYRVEELLGAGSSGEVWRGRVNATGAAVALKRIWLSDDAQRRAALSEAAMLSALDHPHLMKLHELHRVDDDAIVLVLDLASGGSLASLLARRGRLTLGETITAIAPIGAALAYAHHAGVVHGDVSAANILFTDVGLPLLADLGVSRLLGDAAPVRTTPAYADPAVASGALPGPASDVFMLAGIALHALTGSPPWPGIVPAEVLEAACSGEQPDFAGRLSAANVASGPADVIARALNIEPALRGTAADFALDLRHSGEPVAVELTAGRPRLAPSLLPAGERSGDRVESWPLRSVPAGPPSASDAGPVVPFIGEQPLTYGVRAPSPFARPAAARHLARSRPRLAGGLVLCAVLLAAAIASAVWWWPLGGGPESAPAAPTAAAGAQPVPQDTKSGAEPLPRSTAAAPVNTARVLAVLADLDARRAAAFATRDPALLASVYASRRLLARDRALLMAIVPFGCGLHGVHTDFSRLDIMQRTADRVHLRVRTALSPSTLVCGGTASGRAAGSPPTAVDVVLVRHGAGYRIASERHVGPRPRRQTQ